MYRALKANFIRLLLVAAPGRVTALAGAAVAALLLAVCGGSTISTPTPDPRIGQALEKLDRLTEMAPGLEGGPVGAATTATPKPAASAQPAATAAPAGTAASKSALPQVRPTPTPNPANSAWIQQRFDALIRLYDFTDSGDALLRSLDVRQMRGEPGFFGSYGFKSWAGVGEAKPTGVVHEIGHSYWGAFPVLGFPELSWETRPGQEFSPAMQRYHADILSFMAQPPDDYELFRQRLRNLPELSEDNQAPLLHSLEADMVYSTGGNLTLAPPILRKYWSQFLKDGPFNSWYDAVSWYRSLSDDERSAANKYLGFEHLDLRRYDSLAPNRDPRDLIGDLIGPRLKTLAAEERQRLFDLADQFDLLLGEAQEEEKFQFWRGYLRDKLQLHGLHPGYLASLDLPRAAGLASALEFLTGLAGLPREEQARRMGERLPNEPFLVNFLPALDNRTLQELFGSGVLLPQGSTLQVTASFVDRLERFGGVVDGVLTAGRASPSQGAQELNKFLSNTDFAQKEDLRLFFDLLREEDPATASKVVQALDKETIRRLMDLVPVQLRFTLNPEELLGKLDITAGARVPDLKRGIELLIAAPSGNFIIDEPFLNMTYEVISARQRSETVVMVGVLQETLLPLEGFIQQQPRAAAALLSSDLETSVGLLRESDPVVSPPARIVYRLIYSSPTLAARLVQALDERGEAALVVESLAYLAYDKARSDRVPSLPISLEQDGRFLRALLNHLGESVMARRLRETFAVFGDRASAGEVAADFLSQYKVTLEAAAATVSDALIRESLQRIISEVAGEQPARR